MMRVGPDGQRQLAAADDAVVIERADQETRPRLQLAADDQPVVPGDVAMQRGVKAERGTAGNDVSEQMDERGNVDVELEGRDGPETD